MAHSRSRIVLFQHRCDALVALLRVGSFRKLMDMYHDSMNFEVSMQLESCCTYASLAAGDGVLMKGKRWVHSLKWSHRWFFFPPMEHLIFHWRYNIWGFMDPLVGFSSLLGEEQLFRRNLWGPRGEGDKFL